VEAGRLVGAIGGQGVEVVKARGVATTPPLPPRQVMSIWATPPGWTSRTLPTRDAFTAWPPPGYVPASLVSPWWCEPKRARALRALVLCACSWQPSPVWALLWGQSRHQLGTMATLGFRSVGVKHA
jgi:hypothetical protein